MLQNVGKMVVPNPTKGQKMMPSTDLREDDYCRGVHWPMCLNGGDIARDGKILIRNYECTLKSLYQIVYSGFDLTLEYYLLKLHLAFFILLQMCKNGIVNLVKLLKAL